MGIGKMKRLALRFGLCGILALTVFFGQMQLRQLRGDRTDSFQPEIDEPNHFMTGLMIRDYAAHGLGQNPLAFAKEYYLHYPKVSFGSWPPLFHLTLGAWLVPFQAGRAASLALIDSLTAMLAVSAAWAAARQFPAIWAGIVGIAVWLNPATQRLTRSIQADTQYALLSFLCVILFVRYLEQPGARRALWFGLAFWAALMTKNNALFLFISLPAALALSRSWRTLRRADLWLAGLPAVLSMALWQYLTLPFVRNNMTGLEPDATLGLTVAPYLEQLARLVWIGLLPLSAWGLYRRVLRPLRLGRPVAYTDAAWAALLVGPWLFHSMLPHLVNQRYLLPSLPSLLVFSLDAAAAILAWPPLAWAPQSLKTAALACLLIAPPGLSQPPSLLRLGYGEIAQELVARFPSGSAPTVLVGASFAGEGVMVDELAVREPRPGHWVIRAIKLMRRRTGSANRQTALVNTPPDEMLRYFRELPLSVLVLADAGDPETSEQIRYLAAMIRANPELFEHIVRKPVGGHCAGAPCTIDVFRFTAANPDARFRPDKLPANMSLWPGV